MIPNRCMQDGAKAAAEVEEAQSAFVARGLASLAASKESGKYFSSEEVLRELDEMLARAKLKAQK